MTHEDHGSSRALGSAFLLLIGGLLMAVGLWFGFQSGLRQPPALALGILASGYFLISGGVRVAIGLLTRFGRI